VRRFQDVIGADAIENTLTSVSITPKSTSGGAAAAAAWASSAAATAAPTTSSAVAAERFTEFAHLDVVLSPVRGVFEDAKNPELPLADAVKSVGLDIDAHVYSARAWTRTSAGKKAITDAPGMTSDRAAAVWLYTCESPMYRELNNALRSTDRTKLKTEYFPYLRLLLSALAVLRKVGGGKPRMVSRGVKEDLVAKYPDELKPGETMILWAFTSTTSKISVLKSPLFLGTSGPRTMFQILTYAAVDVSEFSAIGGESEWLIPPGTALTITDILHKDASGLTVLTCEDDPDAPKLLA
jgi:hypothetical protein